MKEFSFIPTVCRTRKVLQKQPDGSEKEIESQSTFSGSITFTRPSFTQRYDYIQRAQFKLGPQGEVQDIFSNIQSLVAMIGLIKEHFVKVELTRLSDGTVFDSYESLQEDSDCDAILFESAALFFSGFKPSKN